MNNNQTICVWSLGLVEKGYRTKLTSPNILVQFYDLCLLHQHTMLSIDTLFFQIHPLSTRRSKYSANQQIDLLLAIKHTDVKIFAQLGAAYNYCESASFRVFYLPNVHALSFTLANKNLHIGFEFDDINISKTRFLDLNASVQYRF